MRVYLEVVRFSLLATYPTCYCRDIVECSLGISLDLRAALCGSSSGLAGRAPPRCRGNFESMTEEVGRPAAPPLKFLELNGLVQRIDNSEENRGEKN